MILYIKYNKFVKNFNRRNEILNYYKKLKYLFKIN